MPTSRKLLFAIITLVLFYGALEIVARLAAPFVLGEGYADAGAREIWKKEGWIVDPVLGWTLIPNHTTMHGPGEATTHSRGFRGPEFSIEKDAGTLRILTVGDSTAFGFGVQQNEVFAALLQEEFETRGSRKVEVLNFGMPGFTSEQVRLLLETRGMALAPDVIIFLSNFNDRRAVAPGGQPDSQAHFESVARSIRMAEAISYSAATRVIRSLIFDTDDALVQSGDYDFDEISVDSPARVSVDRYEENIRAIVDLGGRDGASVILVALPDNPSWNAYLMRAARYVEEGELFKAEIELHKNHRPVYNLLARKRLNAVLAAQGREGEIRPTVTANYPAKSTGGHSPVHLHTPYTDVLERVAAETDAEIVTVRVPPGVEPRFIYGDVTHLNVEGHRLLTAELIPVIEAIPAFGN